MPSSVINNNGRRESVKLRGDTVPGQSRNFFLNLIYKTVTCLLVFAGKLQSRKKGMIVTTKTNEVG